MNTPLKRVASYIPGGCTECHGTLIKTINRTSCMNCGRGHITEDEGLYFVPDAPEPEPIRVRVSKARATGKVPAKPCGGGKARNRPASQRPAPAAVAQPTATA